MTRCKLTQRQAEVARLVVRGLKDEQIARLLGISPRTVETLIRRGKERLGVLGCHRTEYVAELVQAGYGDVVAERQPLTDEQIAAIAAACKGLVSGFVIEFARAIEAAHGITGEQK